MFYFLNLHRSHVLDLIMQSLFIKTQSSPLEAPYFSCVPYLLGEGQAMQYSVWPKTNKRTPIPRSAVPPAGRLSARGDGRVARGGRRGARLPPAAADRSAPDADREQRGPLAGESCRRASRWPRCACRGRSSIRPRKWSSPKSSPTTRGTPSPSIGRSETRAARGNGCITSFPSCGTTLNDVPHFEPTGDEVFE